MPLFFEKTIPREAPVGNFTFPLAAPPGLILPPEIEQIPEISVILRFGAVLGEGVERQGKILYFGQHTTIFFRNKILVDYVSYCLKTAFIIKVPDIYISGTYDPCME